MEYFLLLQMYMRTHGVEMVDGENLLIGSRAKKTMADYNEKLVEYKNKGVGKAPDDVYLEVGGGRKKCKIYGLGTASSLFYKAPMSSQTTESSNVPLISQLFSKLEECKKMAAESLKLAQDIQEAHEKEKTLWTKEREINRAKMDKLYNMPAQMSDMLKSHQCCSSRFIPSTTREPRDPSGGGSPCANK